MSIDRSKISMPQIVISPEAMIQWQMMVENDPTIANKIFRIEINGKGCDGFKYFFGPHMAENDDFIVIPKDTEGQNLEFNLHLSPFCAYYLKDAFVDYQFDPSTEDEGFIVNNSDEKKFNGKFWLKDQSKLPPVSL